ncbi:Translation initiation factor 3 subunit b [Allomyces arbusculus]|nr:Translation initiation factor 3 subunit b [Allomyces arbusculus]
MAPAFNIDAIPLDIDLTDDAALDEFLDFGDIEEQYAVHVADQFDTILVIDGVPVVDEGKKEKLFTVIRKQFGKEGVHVKDQPHGFMMPMDAATGKSKGFVFVDFATPADADKALKHLQYFKFDKSHTFFLNKFADVEKYAAVPDQWDEERALGKAPEYVERGFLRDWLLDAGARDQIAVFNKTAVSVMWGNKANGPDVIHERENWTEGYIAWSPRGSYLASVHRMGIALWGGAAMDRLMRFHHPGVRFLDFSPKESYLVTFSPEPLPMPTNPAQPWGPESAGHHVIVWDIRTGHILRSFALSAEEIATKNVPWPLFKWSFDEAYFARIVGNAKLAVYEAPGMGLLDKKSIPIPGITEFEWMPYTPDEDEAAAKDGAGKKKQQQNKRVQAPPYTIAYFVPQTGPDQPAQLALMSLPNKQVYRSKQVFFGLSAKIHFQSQGDYLLFKVDRTNRSGKASFVSLEVFRLREKDYPADSVEVKEIMVAFGWEPHGNRFAMITTSDVVSADLDLKAVLAGAPGKMTAHIYQVEAAVEKKGASVVPGGVKLVKALERKAVNALYWSPKGRYIVFAGLRNLQGVLEFYDVDATAGESNTATVTTSVNGKTVTSTKEVDPVQLLAATEHHGSSDVAWDPTGRYVMSSVTMWAKGMDNGVMLFDVRGTMLYKHSREQLKQALWRPRPPTLLPKHKQAKVRKNIKQYARDFEIEDATASSALSAAELEERRRLFDAWIQFRSRALLAIEAEDEIVTVLDN